MPGDGRDGSFRMRELLRSNDLVRISWLEALLSDAGIETVVLDGHMSVLEGSIGSLPRRMMVLEEDYQRARWVLAQADEAHELSEPLDAGRDR